MNKIVIGMRDTYKKIYTKPELEVIAVDNQISMQVTSSDENPFSAFESEPEPTISSSDSYSSSSENDPFGGDSPF